MFHRLFAGVVENVTERSQAAWGVLERDTDTVRLRRGAGAWSGRADTSPMR